MKSENLFTSVKGCCELSANKNWLFRVGFSRQKKSKDVAIFCDFCFSRPVYLIKGSLTVQKACAVQYRQAGSCERCGGDGLHASQSAVHEGFVLENLSCLIQSGDYMGIVEWNLV